jgi:hypothetical protein
MRSGFYFIPTTALAGIALLALPFHLFAQQSGLRLTATPESPQILPDAPRPQFELAAVDPQESPALADSNQNVSAQAASSTASDLQTGNISGTTVDTNGDIIPGATVVLDGPTPKDHRTVTASNNGAFQIDKLQPETPYHVTISAKGFVSWSSPTILLKPGQFVILTDARLRVSGGVVSVTVTTSTEQIAVEQVRVAEQQRVLGFIPNFYVVYDRNPVPLTTKLKFSLALKTSIDPVTFIGAAFVAGIDQAANTPNYVLGAKGYGQRFGATYANGVTDIMFGGAILPTLLHQDPRYYYQGTGTNKSRALHAISSPFRCKGDNGKWQPNYSTFGGDLISASISNAYYPDSNRGAWLVFSNLLTGTAERMAADLVQEFVLRRFTPKAKEQN